MGIIIKCLHTGVVVDYASDKKGCLIGHAGGHEIRLLGDTPKNHTLNQTLAMCLPHIVQLTGTPARDVSYARLMKKSRPIKVSDKQKGLFNEQE